MKNSTFITSAVVAALSAGAAGAEATYDSVGSSSYEAGVSLLIPENTGFMYNAQVDALGVGTGTSAVSTNGASFTLSGFASTKGNAPGANSNVPVDALTSSGSGVYSDFTFDRTVTTNATSAAQGRVVATGEALGSIGGVGSAAGKSTQQTIVTATTPVSGQTAGSVVDTLTSSTSSSESAASLIGGARTSLVAGVVGTTDTFVGDSGTTVHDKQVGSAVAGLKTSGDDSKIDITAAKLGTTGTGQDLVTLDIYTTAELEDLFKTDRTASNTGITGIHGVWGSPALDLAVENLGGGTVSLGAETGGFFTGGVSTLGKSGLNSSTSTSVIEVPAPAN